MQPIARVCLFYLSLYPLIINGAYTMNKSREVTIYDIAKELNLSASTVSRSLKGNTIINKATREKVTACAERMGYRSNAFARNLRKQKTFTIGAIIPRLDSSFMSTCLAGMEEVANNKGYNLIISQSHESIKKEAENAKTMFDNRVDGVIVSLTVQDSDLSYFKRFKDKNVPVVFFDRIPSSTENMCFVVDNYNAAYNIAEHLIVQGCNRLVHLTTDSKSNVYVDRYEGFKQAAIDNGCDVKAFFLDELNIDSGKEGARQILAMDKLPDGIFVSNDMAAIGCMLELKANGIEIPSQIAIVGFNNDVVSTIVSPQLSTVSYPGREAGILAAKCLIGILDGEQEFKLNRKVVLTSELEKRESSLRK
jgi:LacI family transcriptional regulator